MTREMRRPQAGLKMVLIITIMVNSEGLGDATLQRRATKTIAVCIHKVLKEYDTKY